MELTRRTLLQGAAAGALLAVSGLPTLAAIDELVIAYNVNLPSWDPDTGYEAAKALMTAHPDLTALIAGNDSVAFGIYQALAELGLRVPDDVSVVSFDDEALASYLRPGLTTARLPYEEMARRGMGMLLGERELAYDSVPMPVIRRDSVRSLV